MNAHFLNSEILDVDLPESFSALLSSVADIAFVTDRSGTIVDLIWNLEKADGFEPGNLVGSRISDYVTRECLPKIDQMLKTEGQTEGGRHREINHRIDGLEEFPVRYNTVGFGETVIFIGQEIRAVAALQSRLVEAQRALDEDYSRLRQLETQYRVLFQTSSEALLVVDTERGRIVDVNSAAKDMIGDEALAEKGQSLEALFAPADTAAVRDALNAVSTSGQASQLTATLRDSTIGVTCRFSIFRAANASMVLCALSSPTHSGDAEIGLGDKLVGMAARIPDAMVLTDAEGQIRWCNDAFLGMSEIALPSQAENENLARFLGRPGVDLDIIIANARETGRLRAFSSTLTGAYGSETRVEISVATINEPQPMIGFVMRDISRYDQIPARKPEGQADAATDLMKLVGTVPLKELVRASTEEIEKMCIQAALKKTGDNRASAAEMLGLSRQSLYVKLRRFGLLDRNGG